MDLFTSIRYVKGIGPIMANRLKRLEIETVEDLLFHIPFRYDDFSQISPIEKVREGQTVTVRGVVNSMKNIYTRTGKNLQKATIADESGNIDVIWFNQSFLTQTIKKGYTVSLSGKPKRFGSKLTLQSPSYEILSRDSQPTSLQGQTFLNQGQTLTFSSSQPIHTGRLVPIYPATADLTPKWIRAKIRYILLEIGDELKDFLPEEILQKEKFLKLNKALEFIHFPPDAEKLEKAKTRLAFDELFKLQLISQIRRSTWKKNRAFKQFTTDNKQISKLIKSLPFKLTSSQEKVIQEISNDLEKSVPMNRLLQGDVGSGKTVVAAICAYSSHLNNCNTLIMAPTEILATQQAQTLQKLLSPFKVKISLITGSTPKLKRQQSSITVGTHALLHEKNLNNVGLVIIDEQHRFGVSQRALIRQKSGDTTTAPHILTMTATPIPRTIALTAYGDLDLSNIDEMPKGRKKIKTWVVPPSKRNNAYKWIQKQKTQTFIICPFIEPSESLETVKAAKSEFEKLKKEIFPNLKIGLIHGKLKAKEKNQILKNLKNNKLDVLVATPVVEVGIDIPNASIIVIEAAERFGLAQLHQLRGRVGRKGQQAYCLLFSESRTPMVLKRLKLLERSHTGSILAQRDLELRGQGDIYGTKQHGFKSNLLASYANTDLIIKAKYYAQKFIKKSPSLSSFPLLHQKIKESTISHISPN